MTNEQAIARAVLALLARNMDTPGAPVHCFRMRHIMEGRPIQHEESSPDEQTRQKMIEEAG